MRHITAILPLLVFCTNLSGQKTNERERSSWKDTSYLFVHLQDTIKDTKVVAVEVGKKAIIYVKLNPMMNEARKNLSNDFIKEDNQKIIFFFDSASALSDTIIVEQYYKLSYFGYLVSHQLEEGNASVYYKKQKSFVDTISHRLEKYGGNADRFFYLPDRRPFFAVKEAFGIIENDSDLTGKGRFEEYVREGEKLQSLGKE